MLARGIGLRAIGAASKRDWSNVRLVYDVASYFRRDGLNSVRTITNAAGERAKVPVYRPFGYAANWRYDLHTGRNQGLYRRAL